MAASSRYYDGATAQVSEVGVRVTAAELIIFRPADSGIVARWPIADLAVLGDANHEAVPPVVRRGGEARLVIRDAELRRQLAGLVPQLTALADLPTPVGRRVATLGVTLAALVGLFWVVVDYGTEYAAPWLPYSLQAKLGESVFEELVADKDECHGKRGLEAINDLANRLARAAGYEHEVVVHVIEGGPVNAFTLPGGILVFYSDLIEQAKDRSQVAGVLAHEIGHVVHHHPIKGIARQYGIELLAKLVSGGYSDLLNTLTSGGNILLALRNGRAFERQADDTGVALLEKLGLRADGIAGFFEQMMEKEPKDAASAAGIWSSHPPTKERIDATKRPTTGRPAFSDADWKALRDVCK
ncbi:MAG: M48 family metallopeptidase [Reyranella sp.]|uniref:M48 family metallopeptidase n=1 Tax=Reyranella sp. TaxID=1929291 RepID=UPI00120702A0|nr:M48 family metallopeptidase [Reyranella sp.]TAJ37458.1 MAG: M48 family metallopeptidase [Reyranella sp.]